jgi:hypothetical protein
MEQPLADAPETPHALHKSIEEFQLRRLGRLYLQEHNYGLISVKDSKLSLLPTAGSVQNPVFEAKDVTRYPGTAIKHAHFRDFPVHLLHDVSSEVTPHELVEKLVVDNPEGHLLVTGMNPHEVLDGVGSFEPSSHHIEYDLGQFTYVFTGSEEEAYSTPISVTKAWLRTSSVCASNGKVYHVTLIDNKLGHCAWHIYCGQSQDQGTRTFSTGSYVRIPASVSGTWADQYLPVGLVTGILSFRERTPDYSTRNLSAKVAQLSTGMNPKTTARERWVATNIAARMSVNKTWDHYLSTWFWDFCYFLSLQWHMLAPLPDIYTFIDERKRTRIIHPTPGGGWSPQCKPVTYRASIPNNPTPLQRFSAFTSAAFVWLLPKLFIGEVAAKVLWQVDYFGWFKFLWEAADISALRLALTAVVIVVTSILPGSIVKVFTRLSGHFWRQLWWPSWIYWAFEATITEVTGGPGYRLFQTLPGRGWSFQFYLWTVATCAVFPGLGLQFAIPWLFFSTAHPLVFPCWLAIMVLENCSQWLNYAAVPDTYPNISHGLASWVRGTSWAGFQTALAGTWLWLHWSAGITAKRAYNAYVRLTAFTPNTGSCYRVGTLPALPPKPPSTVRRRNVDIPLPSVVVLPHRIPGGSVGVALAVEPNGLNFPDWREQVVAAYQANPNQYPMLTPGQACFWDTLEKFGGTAHMWYSWYMAYTRRTPDPSDPVVGNVDLAGIQEFATVSRFGLILSGLVSQIIQPSGSDRPTLCLTLKRSVVANELHIEWTDPTVNTTPVAALARILRTINNNYPAWFTHIQNQFNNAPVDYLAKPTPLLIGMAGIHELPQSRIDIADALVAALTAAPLRQAPHNEGFAFDSTIGYGPPWPDLFEYTEPISDMPIARTAPTTLWQRFRSLRRIKGGHLKLPAVFAHPLAVPGMKIGVSRSQQIDNARRNNQRPEPAVWVTLMNELAQALDKYRNLALPDVTLECQTIEYTADIHRASRLVSDLKAHPSVLETRGNPVVLQSLDAIIDSYRLEGRTVQVPVDCYLGVWGCGKTTATIQYLHTLTPEERSMVRIVSHTESLRAQARISVDFPELRGFNFPTLASIIAEPSTGIIVFDDAGKYWGGVLDLVVLTNPLVNRIVVNGDPCQTAEKFPVAGTQSEFDLSPIHCVSTQATRYATRTHRGFRLLADTLGAHTTNTIQGHITHTVSGKDGIPVCTASPRYVQVLSSYGRRAYTYSKVQGEDFKCDVEIDMTGLEGAILDSAAYTAMTRSSTGVYLHAEAANPATTLKKPPTGSDLMNAVIYAMRASNSASLPAPHWLIKAAFYRHMHKNMPLLPWFANIGASLPAEVFQNVVPVSNTTFVSDHCLHEADPVDYSTPSSGSDEMYVHETHFHAKETREMATRHGQTDQFKETSFVNPHVHKRNDTATYFLSVESRLKSSSYEENLLRMRLCPRTDMCDEYDRLVPKPPRWSALKHEQYVDLAVAEYCSKRTAEAVMAKLKSHDPDRTGADIKITLKNQVIKKAEKRDKVNAIPGQLIHEYDILTTLNDAAYALFLEHEVIPSFPPNFLFYRRMSPLEFIEAYQRSWRVDNGAHSSDVTRWDVGCDAGLLNFDVHLMHRSGFPSDYIEAYIARRLASTSQHGVMATMQNSGDRYTWSLNTVRRAVVTSLVCEITYRDTVAVNGDDAAVDRECHAKPFPDSPWEFKNDNGRRVEFSGFELGGPRPTYSASGLLYRTMILMNRDPSAQDKWVNYLDLLQHAPADADESVYVARCAQQHMQPDLFIRYLPPAFRSLFPTLQF